MKNKVKKVKNIPSMGERKTTKFIIAPAVLAVRPIRKMILSSEFIDIPFNSFFK